MYSHADYDSAHSCHNWSGMFLRETRDLFTYMLLFAHPRRACAARVTVLGLCVCLFVHVKSHAAGYEAAKKHNTNRYNATYLEEINWRFC